jgi:cytochrome c-type biogenesis protein
VDFGLGTFLLGYVAGALSTLSPCVLPLLPILIATATAKHRFGALALATGLVLSFTVVGLFIATLGASLGLDQDVVREFAAVLLVAFGVMLISPPLQRRFALVASRLSASGEGLMSRASGDGWGGQLLVGLLLGLVWSPCVGPTLGAATTLAAQGRNLGQIALLMLLFGLGAGTPLVVIGSLSREAMLRARGALMSASERGKWVFGAALVAMGVSILTGWDKGLETWALDVSPDWLTRLTTRF